MNDSRKSAWWLPVMAVLALLAACASPTMAPSGPGTTRDTSAGKVLTDANGMTLYVYDEDIPDRSNCTGLCAFAWPPVKAPADAQPKGGFTVIHRGGGELQWAYEGKPLYTYMLDFEPGDVKGDGADGTWHVAKP